METIKISYNTKTKLVEAFEEQEFVQEVKKPSLFKKMGLGKKEYADVHFQSGTDIVAQMEQIKNAKKVITNTFTLKEKLVEAGIEKEKIAVFYPSISMEYEKPSEVKKKNL